MLARRPFGRWLAAQWAHFSAVLPDSWRELRTKARREGQHLRLPESLASLNELLTQKKAHLLPTLGAGTPGEGDLLGGYDDGYYYLLPVRLSRPAVEKITGGLPYKSVDIAPKTLSPLSPPFAGRG